MRMLPFRVAVLLLLISLGTNLAMAYRIKVLDERHREFRRVMVLGIGNVARPITAVENGVPVEIAVPDVKSDRDLVIYSYSPRCPSCEANKESFRAFVEATEKTADVIFMVMDDASGRDRRHGAPANARVVSWPSRETQEAYKLGSTPQTIVVRRGRIIGNWFGTYRGRNWEEISKAYRLPSLPVAMTAAE